MIVGRIRQYKARQDVSTRHVYSVIETRQSKATTPKDNSSFSEKKRKSCLRQDACILSCVDVLNKFNGCQKWPSLENTKYNGCSVLRRHLSKHPTA